ncbi:primase/helicase [Pseudomonas phage phiIBB-PAA2]|uniref:Primase/helicase n=1 Tax=Pseudomonas phage phiIBB-PAA2 TaxID=1429758 RepID=V5R4T4_9CAUD|nr:DNA primase/helicase [Pseudomonas phage phiIBB-PAA2]AHB30128.1 primase/helicase [Pseudomonas phage phiIBB-PAA2]
MKQIIGDTACPSCRAKGGDKTGNHLILFVDKEKGTRFGSCNRCGHYEVLEEGFKVPERREKSEEDIIHEVNEVLEYPIKALDTRKISKSIAERYGVRVGISQENGEDVIEHYYPRTRDGEYRAFNVRILDPKAFYYRGSPKGGVDPFGYNTLRHKDMGHLRLVICEDELSAMSVAQIMESKLPEKWKHLRQAAISWSSGVGSAGRDIAFLKESGVLERFNEVIYCHDADDEGRKSVEKVRALYPECKFVELPLKDANDMLMRNRGDEVYQMIRFGSKVKSPDCSVTVDEVYAEALEPPKWGKSYPWEGLTNLTYGQRDGEIIGVGGGTGIGKTLLAHEIAAWNCIEHGENVGTFLLEEQVAMTLKNIAGKVANVPFHRPDIEWDEQAFKDAAGKLRGKLFMWKNKGQNDWDHIKECIRFWAVAMDVKTILLDNMTAMTNHLSPSEMNTEIARICTELAGMADELGLRIFIFSHLNPPKGNRTHEEGAEVKESQFTGSRAMQRWCQLMIGFERNKQADGEEKHESRIRVIKDRNYGNTGLVFTKYNPETGRLVEREGSYDEVPADDDTPI